jgi:hypothetical protein
MATITPQSNYQSNQNYDADVGALFKDYVTGGSTPNDNEPGENIGIDDIRAQISVTVTGMKTADLITSLNINPNSSTPAPTPNTTTPILLAQESRCHAFYRIIGFPVVNSDQSAYYNPGFDITKSYYKQNNLTQKIPLSQKITIASNVGAKFEAISAARENWVATTSQLFSTPTSVEAGVLALTSGTYGSNGIINIRDFNVLKNVGTPFDYTIADQTYATASQSCLVGNQSQLLAVFQDGSANSILTTSTGASKTPSQAFFSHQHIIAPFNVDPRIDFSIWGNESRTSSGTSRRIAVPFVTDASFLQVSSTATAIRPILEGIIRKRVYQASQSAVAGDAVNNAMTVVASDPKIGSIPFIGSMPISNIFSGSVFSLDQQNSFADYLSFIQTLMQKLVVALHKVQAVQGIYYWLPVPNTTGPEGGSQIRDVPLNSNFSQSLITDEDFNIIYNQAQVIFSNISIAATQANGTPDPGGTSLGFNSSPITFNKDTSNAQGDRSTNTMNILGKKRDKKLTDASTALQTIEMILGEFSGFGLVDIVAVVGTLYTMSMSNLMGFLDQDAYGRAQTILGSGIPSQSPIITSMTSLLQGVSGFYQIMDQVFIDTLGNQSLNL